MEEMVRVRLKRCGDPTQTPEWWQFRFEDADTGKLLPVARFKIDSHGEEGDGLVTAQVTIYVDEIDVEMPMTVEQGIE